MSQKLFILILSSVMTFSCKSNSQNTMHTETKHDNDAVHQSNPYYSRTDTTQLNLSDSEWRKVLSDEVYRISRLKETEHAFSGKYWKNTGIGTYYCAACGNPLFRSDSWFASTCGWPSFFETLGRHSTKYEPDTSFGMLRTEVLCGRCGGHLGHVFDDGPAPTHKRYCMNSVVLEFEPDKKQ